MAVVRLYAPEGSYLTNNKRLCLVVEADTRGAMLEDACTYQQFYVDTGWLKHRWRLVRRAPDKDPDA
jgi:hypothetical protein